MSKRPRYSKCEWAFTKAADEARAGFRLYSAKGLVYFADSIHGHVVAHRQSLITHQQAAAQRVQIVAGVSVFIFLLGLAALIIPRIRRRATALKLYAARIQHATKLFERIALALPVA